MALETLSSNPIVLVVEEHALIALDLETSLLNCGAAQVLVAKTVDEAMTLIQSTKIDAAIVDLAPRDAQSLTLANAFNAGKIPFALATTFNTQPPRRAPLDKGFTVEKPFTDEGLKKALLIMLGGRKGSTAQ